MQNAGQQFGQGGASSHQGATYGHAESSQTTSGSITSSLRQFRKKDVEKQQTNDSGTTVARVAPHNHYPPRPQDCYRYPSQFPEYSLPSQVKYSEISDHQPLQEQVSPSVIQKAKGKEYMEMCNVPQPHMKQAYPDHLNNQQPYGGDPNLHHHAQYLQKDPQQVHPTYKPESQFYPKEAQYQQLPHQMQKYNMAPQMRKYPTENDFLAKLRRIHPTMARSIMSDHHLQESQSSYQTMDQNRIYPHQNQRYMNYTSPMQNNPYPHGYMPPQAYPNYPPSCSYTRSPQMPPRFPSTNPHERSISPRRSYTENLPIPPINYPAMPQRISPNYPQYNTPEYAQHYQHRRGPVAPQEYYPQPCRTTQYLPHQMAPQELSENRVTVSDSIKQYIENWADEETASEMNQIESNRLCKENLRGGREEQSTETVYMINASELQYLENGIPLVTSENGIPLVTSENGQYFLKSGVTIDNSTGLVRIVEKTNQAESMDGSMDRVVNLHIVDPVKSDCMLANKPNELSQRRNENTCNISEKSRVVIHQNTVIQPGQQIVSKEAEPSVETQFQSKIGTSLPILTENCMPEDKSPLEKIDEAIYKECKKETVDKNCSPINMEHLEKSEEDFNENISEICPLKLLEDSDETQNEEENSTPNDIKVKNMPIIDLLQENLQKVTEENEDKEEKPAIAHEEHVKNENQEDDITFKEERKTVIKNERRNSETDKENDSATNMKKYEDQDTKDIAIMSIENETKENNRTEDEISVEMVQIEEETKEPKTESTKNETNDEHTPEIMEDVSKMDTSENKNEMLPTMDTKKCEEMEYMIKNYNVVEENNTVIVSAQTATKKNNNINTTNSSKRSEENTVSNVTISEEDINKPTIRRTKRIFSVDDIINHIGNSIKPKPDTKLIERRRSLQITREFLEKEIVASYVFPLESKSSELVSEKEEKNELDETQPNDTFEVQLKEGETDVTVVETEQIVKESTSDIHSKESSTVKEKSSAEKTEEIEEEVIDSSEIIAMDTIEKEETEIIKEEVTVKMEKLEALHNSEEDPFKDIDHIVKVNSENPTESDQKNNQTEMYEQTMDSATDPLELREDDATTDKNIESEVVTMDESLSNASNIQEGPEITINKTNSCDNTNSVDTSLELTQDLNVKENSSDGTSQNEVQYRNAIRVDENNVLLEIAGELVEITVNIVNGKKVITVVPLSESTVVDFNDNYETLDTTQVHEQAKTNVVDGEDNLEVSQLISGEEVAAEPDVIETTSEIIIGMDISLEEEIQLDLEKPQSFSTKAAKKAYENDLQIPSITTSEDIADNSKSNSYSPNDKVSSSKEQKSEKSKNEKKSTTKSSSKRSDSVKKKLKQPDGGKSVVKELMHIRKIKKDTSKQTKDEEKEEFVPFKDLVKARKLKKMKQLQTKVDENVGADSTNKVDQEENSEPESETKFEENEICKHEEVMEDINKMEEKIEQEMKTYQNIADVSNVIIEEYLKENKSKEAPKTKEINSPKAIGEESKLNIIKETKKVEDSTKTSTKKEGTEDIPEKVIKKVTFGSVSYSGPEKTFDQTHCQVKSYRRLEDPRLKSRSNCGILVPSVSELLKENECYANRKKLSLAEYNKRKRKPTDNNDEKETKIRKTHPENGPINQVGTTPKLDSKSLVATPSNRIRIQRPKSLDDIKLFEKPRDLSLVKRKLSLEVTSSKPNHFDWEETQSPKTNLGTHEDPHKRLNEFRGLINNNKSKIIVDVSDLKPLENSEDEILQNYKDQVDSKLNSLNLQIPRAVKAPTSIPNPFSNTETITLMQRFLKNEKLSTEEMEKIKKIISYKRLMQQLDKIKSPVLNTPLNPSYEIRKTCTEKEMKLHLKKIPEKKKRFRNLYTESSSDSDSDFSDSRKSNGDYSVVQSNAVAAGVPKLIIKRKTEMPVPVVRLERLDLKVLANRKRKFC